MAPSSSASSSRKIGKENAPPKNVKASKNRNMDEDMIEEGPSLSGFSAEEDVEQIDTKGKGDSRKLVEVQRKLNSVTQERDRLRTQRETISKQFEELSRLRKSDVEGLFDKYKERAAVQSQAQNDIISNLTTLNEKLQEKVQRLEKSLLEITSENAPPPPDPKEIKALKDELSRYQASIKRKEERFTSLEKEYRTEQSHSKSLQAEIQALRSGSKLAASVSTTPDEAEKDAACLRLYEDITEMCIANVKIRDGGKAGKELIFNCVQTKSGRSLNFKLRSYNHLDPAKVKAKDENPWVRMIGYHPEGLEMETDKEFVARLDVFGKEFTIPRHQLGMMFEELKYKFAAEGE